MNTQKLKQELETKFNKIKEELVNLEQQSMLRKEELLRLQGEFRLLSAMETVEDKMLEEETKEKK